MAARLVAWRAVRRVHAEDAWASPVVDAVLADSGLDARDRALAAHLAFTALRWEGTLDWMLAQVVDRDLADIEVALLDVLRIGVAELHLGRAPAHAVVGGAVEVARRVVHPRTTGFVNGVLRALARRLDELPWPDRATDEGLGLALGYPAWIVAEARARFGDRAEAVLAAGNEPAPLTLRAVADPAVVTERLQAQGADVTPGRHAPEALVVTGGPPPGELDVVREGLAVVQDEASMVVARTAAEGLPPGSLAIDLCAAPGGKATHLAQLGLDVVAVDRHPGRLSRTVALARRTRLPLKAVAADGRRPPLREGVADLVLLDAPCSGLGTVRRRPELRWRRTPEDLDALAQLQADLLGSATKLVKPGGRVVYSVCTWTRRETAGVVSGETALQLSPDVDGTDGMYIAIPRGRRG